MADPVAEAVHLLDALGWPEVRRPLLAEIERLRAIEAAARVLSQALQRGCTTDQLYDAKGALREALGEDGAK